MQPRSERYGNNMYHYRGTHFPIMLTKTCLYIIHKVKCSLFWYVHEIQWPQKISFHPETGPESGEISALFRNENVPFVTIVSPSYWDFSLIFRLYIHSLMFMPKGCSSINNMIIDTAWNHNAGHDGSIPHVDLCWSIKI